MEGTGVHQEGEDFDVYIEGEYIDSFPTFDAANEYLNGLLNK